MTIINSNINTGKFKHLSSKQIDYVISALIAFESEHKGIKRNIGKTEYIKALETDIGACVATVYNLVKDARIVVRNSDLSYKQELSSSAASCLRESNRSMSKKNIKVNVACDFINLVVEKLKSNKYASIDETINSLILNNTDDIKYKITVSTKTFYSYVHRGLVDIKPIDLPRMLRRRKKSYKTYIGKLQRGTCITERPFEMADRSEFGHWEGDLVVGPRDGKKGALLTLIERKTRFYFTIRVKSKRANISYVHSINCINYLVVILTIYSKQSPSIMGANLLDIKKLKLIQEPKNQELKFTSLDHIDHLIVVVMRIVTD